MDTFDRAFRWVMVSFVAAVGVWGVVALRQNVTETFFVCGAAALLVWHSWTSIPKQAREAKLLRSVCGDEHPGGPLYWCNLEPEHPGDHKRVYSNGTAVSWPRKGGA